jgi:hypothetical protein
MLNEINLARADLNLLTLFEVILSERHVGRAALRLNLTPRFAVVSREVPLRLRAFTIKAAVPKVALMDAGLARLFEAMCEVVQGGHGARVRRRAGLRAKS